MNLAACWKADIPAGRPSPAAKQSLRETTARGTYLLLLKCEQKSLLQVGRLGVMQPRPGHYLYVGSAFGPGGIAARVRHHGRISASPHWHIDYLRAVCKLLNAWCVYDRRLEHDWAGRLLARPGFSVPMPGFGASDCRCRSHLFHTGERPGKTDLEIVLDVGLAPAPVPVSSSNHRS